MTEQLCRECTEGKCGACDGTAIVEEGRDLFHVDCLCAARNHEGEQ